MLVYVAVLLLFNTAHGAVEFGKAVQMGQVLSPELTDNSGLGASRLHPSVVYGHNDAHDANKIYALNVETGEVVATLTIQGATNTDWEDLSVGPCGKGQNGSCIYIADIGGDHPSHAIYKVQEPAVMKDATLTLAGVLTFRWQEPDGEGMVVDPKGQVYVISKVSGGNGLFAKLPSSGWDATSPVPIPSKNTVRLGLHSTHHDPLGADLSPDGRSLLVKCREQVYYFRFGPNPDYVGDLPLVTPQVVDTYIPSDNGQAVAWSPDERGFYVLPEGRIPTLDFYPVSGTPGAVVG